MPTSSAKPVLGKAVEVACVTAAACVSSAATVAVRGSEEGTGVLVAIASSGVAVRASVAVGSGVLVDVGTMAAAMAVDVNA